MPLPTWRWTSLRPLELLTAGLTVVLVALPVIYLSQSYELVFVPSSSMEPNVPVGSLALIQKGALPSVGDVAVATQLGQPIIHRVIWINGTSSQIGFRGDAANGTSVLSFSDVVGVMVFAVPLLGYLPLSVHAFPYQWMAGSGALMLLAAGFSLTKNKVNDT